MVVPTINQGVASSFHGFNEDGAVFITHPHPDRLNGYLLTWEAVVSAVDRWDRESDWNNISSEQDHFFVQTDIMSRMVLEALHDPWASDMVKKTRTGACLLYTSPSPRDGLLSRMPSSA